MEYKLNSFNNYDFLKKQNLVRLIRILASNLRFNQKALPWGEKNYGMAKHIFVRKICKAGHDVNLPFEYIYQLKIYIRSDEVEVDEIVNLEFFKRIDPDFMITD